MGEATSDAGGFLREWASELIKEFFSPKLGLFERCDTPQITYKIKESSSLIPRYKNFFRLFGLVVGKSLFEKIPMNLCFTLSIYKCLNEEPFTLDDVKYLDESVFYI